MVKPATVQRVAASASGLALAGAAYVHLHKTVWSSTAGVLRSYGQLPEAQLPEAEPLYGRKARAVVAQKWNSIVDSGLSAVLQYLSPKST